MQPREEFAELLLRHEMKGLVAVNEQGLAMLEVGESLGEAFASYLPMAVETSARLGETLHGEAPAVLMLAFAGKGVLLAARAEAGGQGMYLAAWGRRPPRGTKALFARMRACVARAMGIASEEGEHG